jgi:hypothetical protein
MQIFNRSKPRDVLFLMPVRWKDEKPNGSKVRMLYCDIEGKVYASPISRAVYETARANSLEIRNRRRPFATVGIETHPGDFVPTTIEIDERELWALEHISQHAIKTGCLPDILKKHLKSIINRGVTSREATISEFKTNKTRNSTRSTPKVLNRLPYYRERDIELSMPIYKAEQSYPLIVMKFLPNKNGGQSQRNLLVLDSDGDLAVIKVPAGLINGAEKKLTAHNDPKTRNVYTVIYRQPRGRTVDFMTVNQSQRKALETITRYYEETGSGKQSVPVAVRTVISMAEKRMIPGTH